MYFVTISFGVTKKIWYVHLRKNGAYMGSVQKDYNQGIFKRTMKKSNISSFSRPWICSDDARSAEPGGRRCRRCFLFKRRHWISGWLQFSQVYWVPHPPAALNFIAPFETFLFYVPLGTFRYFEIKLSKKELRLVKYESLIHNWDKISTNFWRRSSDERKETLHKRQHYLTIVPGYSRRWIIIRKLVNTKRNSSVLWC